MKNREMINNMSTYDLLRKIESYINNEFTTARVSDRIFCIQEVFDSRFTITNELGYKQHVCPHEDKGFITSRDCRNCLNDWLNEEVYDNE